MKIEVEKNQDITNLLAPYGIKILESTLSGNAIDFKLLNGEQEELVRQSGMFSYIGAVRYYEYGFSISLDDPYYYEGFDRVKTSFKMIKKMMFLKDYQIEENRENCIDFRTGKRQVNRTKRW